MRVVILKLLVNIGGFYLASLFFPNITFDQPSVLLWAGLVLGIVNILVRPALVLLTLPINLFTFGLFTLVINTLMVLLTGTLIRGLHIPGFGHALAIAIFISVINMFLFD
ncbi:MAG TPA: phage holin family protein [Firmicutes bacterium]|nr:phage holin family protein [Bacillota bacterium]